MSDILPDLSDLYPVSEEQIEAFRRDGHVYLPGVCSPEEVAAYREVIRTTAFASFGKVPALEDRDAFGQAFLQTLNIRLKNKGVCRFALARRFGGIVARLLGAEKIRIYHDQALFKEPGGARSPLHQDQYYWPLATEKAVGMWMPLVDVSMDMGPILFASGSHTEGFAGSHEISDASQEVFERVISEKGYPISQRSMRAGDATFHNAWTIHGASANKSKSLREAMIVAYYPDGTRVDVFNNASRVADAEAFLGNRQPGELADSNLNTVVYS